MTAAAFMQLQCPESYFYCRPIAANLFIMYVPTAHHICGTYFSCPPNIRTVISSPRHSGNCNVRRVNFNADHFAGNLFTMYIPFPRHITFAATIFSCRPNVQTVISSPRQSICNVHSNSAAHNLGGTYFFMPDQHPDIDIQSMVFKQ